MDKPQNTIGTATGNAKPYGEVPAKLDSLNIAALDLMDTLRPFLDRLQPVTRQEPSKDTVAEGQAPSSTPVGQTVADITHRLRLMQQLILQADDTLEL